MHVELRNLGRVSHIRGLYMMVRNDDDRDSRLDSSCAIEFRDSTSIPNGIAIRCVEGTRLYFVEWKGRIERWIKVWGLV